VFIQDAMNIEVFILDHNLHIHPVSYIQDAMNIEVVIQDAMNISKYSSRIP